MNDWWADNNRYREEIKREFVKWSVKRGLLCGERKYSFLMIWKGQKRR